MEQQRGDGGNEMEARLLETIRARLVENGSLNQIKSELRAIVINDVREGDKSPLNSLDGGDGKSPTQIANHLILEYLEWVGLQYTMNMFSTESGCTTVKARDYVESKAGIKDGQFDKELPVLMTLAINLIKNGNKKENK